MRTAASGTTGARRRGAALVAALLGPVLALGSPAVLASPAAAAEVVQAAQAAQVTGPVTDVSLDWGVKQSFRQYIQGPIAKGAVALDAPATALPDGTYRFTDGEGTSDAEALTLSVAGGVRFTGHDMGAGPLLDVAISDVRLEVAADGGVLRADVVSRGLASGELVSYPDVAFADVDVNTEDVRPDDQGVFELTGLPATLTPEAVPAFADFYEAGSALDPVSVRGTVVAEPEPEPEVWEPVVGLVDAAGEPVSELPAEGGVLTVRGSGFDPLANAATRPPVPVGSPAGAYVVVGDFDAQWRPSQGATGGSRRVLEQAWVMPKATIDVVGQLPGLVRLEPDGTFEVTFEVERPEQVQGVLGVYTYPAGGAVNAAQETATPITFAEPEPEPEPEPTSPVLSLPEGTEVADGDDLEVSGSGFAPERAVYVAVTPQGTSEDAHPSPFSGAQRVVTTEDGTLHVTLEDLETRFSNGDVEVDCAEVGCFVAAFSSLDPADNTPVDRSGDRTQDAFVALPLADERPPGPGPATFVVSPDRDEVMAGTPLAVTVSGLAAGEVVRVDLGDVLVSPSGAVADADGGFALTFMVPVDQPAGPVLLAVTGAGDDRRGSAVVTVRAVQPEPGDLEVVGGAVDWGVKESFRAYVTGSIARGTVDVVDPATRNGDGTFRFPVTGGEALGDGLVATTDGTVSFRGHVTDGEPLLSLVVSDVSVVVDGGEATLVGDVRSRSLEGDDVVADDVLLADLDLTGESLTPVDGVIELSDLPATLTEAGAPAFGGFYYAGESLDPVSATLLVEEGATVPPRTRRPHLHRRAGRRRRALLAWCVPGPGRPPRRAVHVVGRGRPHGHGGRVRVRPAGAGRGVAVLGAAAAEHGHEHRRRHRRGHRHRSGRDHARCAHPRPRRRVRRPGGGRPDCRGRNRGRRRHRDRRRGRRRRRRRLDRRHRDHGLDGGLRPARPHGRRHPAAAAARARSARARRCHRPGLRCRAWPRRRRRRHRRGRGVLPRPRRGRRRRPPHERGPRGGHVDDRARLRRRAVGDPGVDDAPGRRGGHLRRGGRR